MGARLLLLICGGKTGCLDPEWRLSIGLCLHQWFCAFKTATLASELLVSIVPSPHLWLLHAKQRLWDQNHKSLWVQHSYVVLCIQNSDIMTRINTLHGYQTLPVVLWMQNRVISSRNTILYGSQTSPVVLFMQNNVISIRITSLYGSQTSPVVLCMQNSVISSRTTSLQGSQTSPIILCM